MLVLIPDVSLCYSTKVWMFSVWTKNETFSTYEDILLSIVCLIYMFRESNKNSVVVYLASEIKINNN